MSSRRRLASRWLLGTGIESPVDQTAPGGSDAAVEVVDMRFGQVDFGDVLSVEGGESTNAQEDVLSGERGESPSVQEDVLVLGHDLSFC